MIYSAFIFYYNNCLNTRVDFWSMGLENEFHTGCDDVEQYSFFRHFILRNFRWIRPVVVEMQEILSAFVKFRQTKIYGQFEHLILALVVVVDKTISRNFKSQP